MFKKYISSIRRYSSAPREKETLRIGGRKEGSASENEAMDTCRWCGGEESLERGRREMEIGKCWCSIACQYKAVPRCSGTGCSKVASTAPDW